MSQMMSVLRPFCMALMLPAAALAQQVESRLPGIEFTRLDSLPANPTPLDDKDLCINSDAPTTVAGKKVADAGWGVISERQQEGYDFIAFVGATEGGTSGSCRLDKGNVGVFKNDQIVALLYGEGEQSFAVAGLAPLEAGGLRVWNGDFLRQPVGDLHVDETGLIRFIPIAKTDSFCRGAIELPTLYDQPIDIARKAILAAGWTPVPADAENRETWSDYVKELVAGGLEELHDCSPTGFGYCSYEYSRATGQRLSVTTAGEGADGHGPRIADYLVTCE